MSGFTLDVKGFDEVLKKLDTKTYEQDITDELEAFGADVSRDAKQILASRLKHSMGGLINSIDFIPGRMRVEIVANKDYAAYVEFGTGPYAAAYVPSLEPEFQAYAMQFFVNGKGRTPATPFLYPSYEKNRLKLMDRLRNFIK